MRAWIALLATWQIACSGAGVPETYDYLVTPDGQRFRVISAGPIVRGANTLVGMRVTYISRAKSPADLLAHADTLVRALGPEFSLSREPTLTVRARLGPASISLKNREQDRYDLEYRLSEGEYQRSGASESETPPLAGTHVADDPSFPFRPALLNEAVDAGNAWLALANGTDLRALRADMAPDFLAKLSDDAQLGDLILQRKLAGGTESRRELYRMQQRPSRKGRSPGDDARVVFESGMPSGQRLVERLVLARDGTRWQVSGYAFQPVPR